MTSGIHKPEKWGEVDTDCSLRRNDRWTTVQRVGNGDVLKLDRAVPSLIRGRNRGSGQMSLGFWDFFADVAHTAAALHGVAGFKLYIEDMAIS